VHRSAWPFAPSPSATFPPKRSATSAPQAARSGSAAAPRSTDPEEPVDGSIHQSGASRRRLRPCHGPSQPEGSPGPQTLIPKDERPSDDGGDRSHRHAAARTPQRPFVDGGSPPTSPTPAGGKLGRSAPVAVAKLRSTRPKTTPSSAARSHRIDEAPPMKFSGPSTKPPLAIVVPVYLTSTIRSQGSSPSQRFDPASGLWVCFTPHPPMGFSVFRASPARASRSASRRPLLSCRSVDRDVYPVLLRLCDNMHPKTHVTTTEPTSTSERCSSRASVTRRWVVHPPPGRCSLDLSSPSRLPARSLGDRPPLLRFTIAGSDGGRSRVSIRPNLGSRPP